MFSSTSEAQIQSTQMKAPKLNLSSIWLSNRHFILANTTPRNGMRQSKDTKFTRERVREERQTQLQLRARSGLRGVWKESRLFQDLDWFRVGPSFQTSLDTWVGTTKKKCCRRQCVEDEDGSVKKQKKKKKLRFPTNQKTKESLKIKPKF